MTLSSFPTPLITWCLMARFASPNTCIPNHPIPKCLITCVPFHELNAFVFLMEQIASPLPQERNRFDSFFF